MFQLVINQEKNRLYVTLEGHLDLAERKAAAQTLMAEVKKLQPGFDIIHNMTGLHPTDPEGLKELLRIQAALKIKGVRTVIRIVKIPLSSLQFERMSQETGWTFEIAATVQEADARLDALGPAPKPE